MKKKRREEENNNNNILFNLLSNIYYLIENIMIHAFQVKHINRIHKTMKKEKKSYFKKHKSVRVHCRSVRSFLPTLFFLSEPFSRHGRLSAPASCAASCTAAECGPGGGANAQPCGHCC